jgi:sec-independent protein translocase protein TatC
MSMDLQHEIEHTAVLPHLVELRSRIGYALLAVAVGIVAGWWLFPHAFHLVSGPVLRAVHAQGGAIFTLQPAEAFLTHVKLAVALGVTLASPFIVFQLWRFVRPGLTPQERRAAAPLAPLVCLLFLLGVVTAYLMLPTIMRFFLGFVPPGVAPNISYQESINLPLKVMLAFGLAFQLPVVLVGLVLVRVVTPAMLLARWRGAMVVLGIIAALITPTGDPYNWALMLVPLLVLYFGTVLMAYRFVPAAGPSAPTTSEH